MATNNKKISRDYDALIEAYRLSLGLSTAEINEKNDLEISIPVLKSKISSLTSSIDNAAKAVHELTDVRTEDEINNEISHLNHAIEGLNELKNTEDILKALKTKDPSTLTDEDRDQLIELYNTLDSLSIPKNQKKRTQNPIFC